MKVKKDLIRQKIAKLDRKDLPKQEQMLKQIEMFKKKHPRLYKKLLKQLKKKFPDKEFPD